MAKRVLYVGPHIYIMQKVVNFLENHGYDTTGVFNFYDARRAVRKSGYDLVVVSGGIDKTIRKEIRNTVGEIQPNIPILVGRIDEQKMIEQIQNAL